MAIGFHQNVRAAMLKLLELHIEKFDQFLFHLLHIVQIASWRQYYNLKYYIKLLKVAWFLAANRSLIINLFIQSVKNVIWHLQSWNWSTFCSTINVLVSLNSISQGALKINFGKQNRPISSPNMSKYAYWMIFFNGLCQNNRFLGNSALLDEVWT